MITYATNEDYEIDYIIKELSALKAIGLESVTFGLDLDSDHVNIYPQREQDND